MAWRADNQADFDTACETYRSNAEAAVMTEGEWRNIDRELSYNRRNWFTQARLFYILTVLTGLILVSFPRRGWWVAVLVCFALGFLCHSTGIVQRMIIMNRPPITNLYATFLFVGWVIAIAGIVLEWITRKGFGLLMGSFCAAVLLFISIRWAIEGDTMRPLVPVLNSNFWLWTHVLTINMGYSGAFFAGVAGHAWLIMAAFKGKRHPMAKLSAQLMYGMIAFGLTFSFIGTMLGGIWADQSWGRF